MRRRHLLALVILALVVATVLAFGPVRVWDWITIMTVTEYYDDGTPHHRYRVRRWSGERVLGVSEGWYEDGTLQFREDWEQSFWAYTPRGALYQFSYGSLRHSITLSSNVASDWSIWGQGLCVNKRYESRTSPPWFTEEEILQAVEGVEE